MSASDVEKIPGHVPVQVIRDRSASRPAGAVSGDLEGDVVMTDVGGVGGVGLGPGDSDGRAKKPPDKGGTPLDLKSTAAVTTIKGRRIKSAVFSASKSAPEGTYVAVRILVPPILIIGDAKFAHSMRGHAPTPGSRVSVLPFSCCLAYRD